MHQKWLYRVMRGEEKKEIVAINVYQAKKLSGWFGEEGVRTKCLRGMAGNTMVGEVKSEL
jgi:hypothetical protein